MYYDFEGNVFQGSGAEDPEGWYRFLNPRATGSSGRLQAGVASGTFIKNPDGSWTIGQGGNQTTSAAGFARLLARLGFDATTLLCIRFRASRIIWR